MCACGAPTWGCCWVAWNVRHAHASEARWSEDAFGMGGMVDGAPSGHGRLLAGHPWGCAACVVRHMCRPPLAYAGTAVYYNAAYTSTEGTCEYVSGLLLFSMNLRAAASAPARCRCCPPPRAASCLQAAASAAGATRCAADAAAGLPVPARCPSNACHRLPCCASTQCPDLTGPCATCADGTGACTVCAGGWPRWGCARVWVDWRRAALPVIHCTPLVVRCPPPNRRVRGLRRPGVNTPARVTKCAHPPTDPPCCCTQSRAQ